MKSHDKGSYYLLLLAALLGAVKIAIIQHVFVFDTDRVIVAVASKIILHGVFLFASYYWLLKCRPVLVLVWIASASYLALQIEYSAYFHEIVSIRSAIGLMGEGRSIIGMTPKLHWVSILAVLDLPIIISLCRQRNLNVWKGAGYVSIAIWICMSGAIAVYRFNEIGTYGQSYIAKCVGFIPFEIATMLTHSLSEDDFQWGRQVIFKAGNEHPDIVVIQVETLDARAIQYKFGGEYVMPNLHRYCDSGWYFPYLKTFHGTGGSSDADFTTNMSVPPADGVISLRQLDRCRNSLVKALGSDYSKAVFHGNEGRYWSRSSSYSRMGYDRLFFRQEINEKPISGHWGATDAALFRRIKEWLIEQKKPAFAYAITISSHGPFLETIALKRKQKFCESPEQGLLNCWNYVDSVLGIFLKDVSEIRPTWVIIFGDHTPSSSAPNYKSATAMINSKEEEFVPLIIIPPKKKWVSGYGIVPSLLDIAPTVLSISSVSTEYQTDGSPLNLYPKIDCSNDLVPLRGGGKVSKAELHKILEKSGLVIRQ